MKTRDLILTALFAALTAVGAFIKIPVGPVPITLQDFFTILSGILLGPYLGALSQLLYLVLGLIGLPVFASGGGLSSIFSPSFGYLLGFILASYVIGRTTQTKNGPLSFRRAVLASLAGLLIIYCLGVPYMFFILKVFTHTDVTFLKIVISGFLVFLPGDIIKSFVAAGLGVKIRPVVKRG